MENVKDVKKEVEKQKLFSIVKKVLIYTFLIFWGLVILFPFYWMLITSLKTFSDYTSESLPLLYVKHLTLENYYIAWTQVKLLRYMANTLIFSLATTAIMLVVSLLASFAFARLEFKGKNLVFTLFLAMMMIPNELVIITNYTTIVNLDLRNTFTGLIMPSVLSVFYIYLLRQNFMQVPDNLYYAAKVDGVSDFNYLCKVLVPLSKPTIVSIVVLKLIECWNSYVWPRLITTSEDYYLVSNAIEIIKSTGFGRDNIPAMMAAVVCVSTPLLILFIIFRKQIMSGVSRTGAKG